MNDRKFLAPFGLKYNPFLPEVPAEGLWSLPGAEVFRARLEALLPQGGFALVTGEPGLGKSKTLQWLSLRLGEVPDAVVGVIERPQSRLGDFYRELGELFGVALSPANRYGGFKALRERWRAHARSCLLRPVLLIDEAQEISTDCLTELRLLASAQFDSQCLLTTVLCGDSRLPERFRCRELLPLGSRIRTRLLLKPLEASDLEAYLRFALDQAGAPHLMTEGLLHTLSELCLGNLRLLTQTAADLLALGAERALPRLDESL